MNQIIYVLYICTAMSAEAGCRIERELPIFNTADACWSEAQKVIAPVDSLIYCYPRQVAAPVATKTDTPASDKTEEKKP